MTSSCRQAFFSDHALSQTKPENLLVSPLIFHMRIPFGEKNSRETGERRFNLRAYR